MTAVVIPELPTDAGVVKFCDLPTANTWASVVPSGLSSRQQDPWDDYSAGCTYVPGAFSDAGAFVRGPASGHHVSGSQFSATPVLQLSDTAGASTWLCKNRPPSDVLFPDVEGTDTHTDDTGATGNGDHGFLANGQQHGFYLPDYAGAPHTYNSPIYFNGALHYLGFGGIPIRRDITQDHGGDTQFLDLTIADGPESNLCVWKDVSGTEQGFFASASIGAGFYGCTLLFKTASPGYDLTYPQVAGNSYSGCGMWIDDANQILCGMLQDGTLNIVDLETKAKTTVAVTGWPNGTAPIKLSPKWLRSRDCALGYDGGNGNFVAFIPPVSGDRRTTNWSFRVMTSTLSSNAPDGSLTSLQTSGNPDVSVWAGWEYNPRWDVGIISPKHDGPVQLVRFPSAIGPAPSPPPTLTPATFTTLSGLHFGFHPNEVLEAELASIRTDLPVSTADIVDCAAYMPGTGARPDLGVVTLPSARWAVCMDSRARANMVSNAKASANFPMHWTSSGLPARFDLLPDASDSDLTPDPLGPTAPPSSNNPAGVTLDFAHDPHLLYFYALLMQAEGNTDEFQWALTEMKFWTAAHYLKMPPNMRGHSKAIFSFQQQVRQAAWGLAHLFQTYIVMPDDDAYKPSYLTSIQENIKFYNGVFNPAAAAEYDLSSFAPNYNQPTSWFRNNLGAMAGQSNPEGYGYGDSGNAIIAGGFQLGFITTVWLWAYKMFLKGKIPGLSSDVQLQFHQLAAWTAKWPIGLFGAKNTAGQHDFRRAGYYTVLLGDGYVDNAGRGGLNYYPDFGALHSANQDFWGALPDDNILRHHDSNDPEETLGYSYFENVYPALSLACDCWVLAPTEYKAAYAPAVAAYARLTNATIWNAAGSTYHFGILPEYL